jgi:hypothetical protein
MGSLQDCGMALADAMIIAIAITWIFSVGPIWLRMGDTGPQFQLNMARAGCSF